VNQADPWTSPRKAAFLDRDGVLNVDVGYPHRPGDLTLVDRAAEGVAILNAAGFFTVIVTNQSGVARGYFSLEEMHAFNDLVIARLAAGGGRIDAAYACPFHSSGSVDAFVHPDHPDRKPNPGMLLRAMADHDLGREGSLMIGDKISDMQAAERAGVKGLHFIGGPLDVFVRDYLRIDSGLA